MRLGELIAALKAMPKKHEDGEPVRVYFDFCGLIPDGLASYRGYYDHLALGHTNQRERDNTIEAVLSDCLKADGATFTGWKGGTYRMGKSTPVWVANPGECDSTQIDRVTFEGYRVILHTKHDEDWA